MAYVMIVDDDEDFANAIATVVKSTGHETLIQLSTRLALQSVAQRKPDLMILDVMFPEDENAGFEFARELQKISKGKRDFPVLMLTAINTKTPLGFNSKDIDEDWLPVDDFVEKPVDLKLLATKVASLLEKNKKK